MPETTQFAGMGGDDSTDSSLQANTVLQRRYKVLGVLGGGGMGTVYQARDLNFPDVRKLVAVKEMLNPTTDPTFTRFNAENLPARSQYPRDAQSFGNP